MNRRNFYRIFINLLGAGAAAVVALPAAAYLLLKPKSASGDDMQEIADMAKLHSGRPEEIVYIRTRIDGWKRIKEKTTAWVVKADDNNVTVFAPQCTHLGCAYHWEAGSKNFLCPCHNSSFAIDGKVLDGPAPKPLDRLVSKIEGGKLLISSAVERT